MIERKFVNQNIKEFEIKEYIRSNLSRVGLSDVKLQRTPLGEKIVISTSRPGLVVGRSGTNITKLTKDLKEFFKFENPQIEIEEITNIGLDANIIAEMIANSLERFGTARFKGIGHKAMADIMNAGAFGVEILISGKVPSSRAKTWRFFQGYLKKCGDIAVSEMKIAYTSAKLKSGTIGIKVSIMTPDIILPDKITLKKEDEEIVEKIEVINDPAVEKEILEKVRETKEEKIAKAKSQEKEKTQDDEPKKTTKKKRKAPVKKKKAKETETKIEKEIVSESDEKKSDNPAVQSDEIVEDNIVKNENNELKESPEEENTDNSEKPDNAELNVETKETKEVK